MQVLRRCPWKPSRVSGNVATMLHVIMLDFGQVGFDHKCATKRKLAIYRVFCVSHQIAEARRSGENWPPENVRKDLAARDLQWLLGVYRNSAAQVFRAMLPLVRCPMLQSQREILDGRDEQR